MTKAKDGFDSVNSDDNPLRLYLNEIGRYPLLTAEEEFELGRRIKDEGDQEARDELIKRNLRLVVSIAKRFRRRGLSFMDLIEEGNQGVIVAAQKYDYKIGCRFSTYATPWIEKYIKKAVQANTKTIRIPPEPEYTLPRIRKVIEEHQEEHGCSPSPAEILSHPSIKAPRGLTDKYIENILRWHAQAKKPASLNQEDEKGCLIHQVPDNKTDDCVDIADWLERTFSAAGLNKHEKEVLRRHFGLGETPNETYKEIGESFGVGKTRIEQIQVAALKKIKAKNPTPPEWRHD